MPIRYLHIEASSYCNARCPGCPRNAYGYPLKGFYKEANLELSKFTALMKRFDEVKSINFCGNHGDPLMHPQIADLVKMSGVFCEIATNGSIGRLETFKSLAGLHTNITFGIDGLANTNHLYRQGVDWNKLMLRVKTYINNGGNATWQFILFQHNKHQIDDAKKMSEDLGFKHFYICNHSRDYFPVINEDKTISHWILPADGSQEPNKDFNVDEYLEARYNPINLNPPKHKVSKINCEHLDGSVYINSLGETFPCCYHGFGHVDRPKVKLEDFKSLQKTWKTDNCNQFCAESCGAP